MFKRIDLGIIIPVVLLCICGYILVMSSSSYYALSSFDNAFYFANRHGFFIIVGLFFMFGIRVINYKVFDISLIFVIVNAIAVAMSSAIFFIGNQKLGATRWISIAGIEFMPVDLAKGAIIFSLAYTLTHFSARKKNFLSLFIHLIFPGLLIVMTVLQPDYSSSLVLFGTVGLMLFVGFEPLYQILMLGAVGMTGAFFVAFRASYRLERIKSFLSSLKNIHQAQDQIKYGIFAIASGGAIGKGPGRSLFNKLYIPHPHNDMIISTLGEEYGFIGMTIVFVLFLILIINLLRLAIKVKNKFAKLLVFGVFSTLFIQLFINIGSTLGLIPPTGISLPFISYGGTNLLIFLMMMGLCLSISRIEKI